MYMLCLNDKMDVKNILNHSVFIDILLTIARVINNHTTRIQFKYILFKM